MIFERTSKIIFIALLTLTLLISCKEDDPTQPTELAPDIPPQSTFIMDFEAFPDTSSPSAFQKVNADTIEFGNWGWAYGNAVVWKAIIDITLAVPRLSFAAAFSQEPVQQEDGSWLWSYNVNVLGVIHTAKLYGTTTAQGVEWKMLLSKDGGYQDFEWYTGFSNLPLTQGSWTLNKDPNDPVPFLQIDWNRNPVDETADIKYTNIIPNDPENGGYIFYGKTTNVPFNAFYDIFNKGKNNHTNVEWNLESYNGRVSDPMHFGDADWHCWDENLLNIVCP